MAPNVRELRKRMGMTQREFARMFDIPLGTVRNWEQGIAESPSYVYRMIEFGVRRDGMINLETLKFIKLIEDLAKKSAVGIKPFSVATMESFYTTVFYSDVNEDESDEHRIVLDACLFEDHHDIVALYEDTDEYEIRANTDDGVYITIRFKRSDTEIVIENGEWYFA